MERILGEALVDLVKEWAARKSATRGQIALAWLMAQKPWIVPIPGTTQMAHMLDSIGADQVRFTPPELAELNASVAAIDIRGARLPDQVLFFSGVEAPAKKQCVQFFEQYAIPADAFAARWRSRSVSPRLWMSTRSSSGTRNTAGALTRTAAH